MELSEQLADHSDDVMLLDDLALAYYNYGLLKDDSSYHIKAADIWGKLSEQTGVGKYTERFDMARTAISRQKKTSDEQIDFADTPEENETRGDEAGFRSDHSKCYILLSQLCQRNGENDEAMQYLIRAATISRM